VACVVAGLRLVFGIPLTVTASNNVILHNRTRPKNYRSWLRSNCNDDIASSTLRSRAAAEQRKQQQDTGIPLGNQGVVNGTTPAEYSPSEVDMVLITAKNAAHIIACSFNSIVMPIFFLSFCNSHSSCYSLLLCHISNIFAFNHCPHVILCSWTLDAAQITECGSGISIFIFSNLSYGIKANGQLFVQMLALYFPVSFPGTSVPSDGTFVPRDISLLHKKFHSQATDASICATVELLVRFL